MSETTYEKIFKVIQSSLVPKSRFEESQKEISVLKSALETAKSDLKLFKSKYEDQKQTIDILNAEKETLQSQKSTCELKLKEVSLKLELKTRQYDLLLKSNETDSSKNATEKASAGTQTIKEEPIEIGIVNTPTSSSSLSDEPSVPSEPSVTEKRGLDADHDGKVSKAKRRKATKPEASVRRVTRSTARVQQKFSCQACLDVWGHKVNRDFHGNLNHKDVPDPKKSIKTFSSFKSYRDHFFIDHLNHTQEAIDKGCLKDYGYCQVKSCTDYKTHRWPHGDIECETCGLSFQFKKHHDLHRKYQHADTNKMSKKDINLLFMLQFKPDF